MKTITKCTLLLCAILLSALSANAQLTSAEVAQNSPGSSTFQAQNTLAAQHHRVSSNVANTTLTATYVGSFNTNDGPYWQENPAVYSGLQAAALIFGGSPSDYAISTNPNTTDPSTITHTANVSIWGVAGCQEVAEDYSLDLGAPGYNNPGGTDSAVSAYVQDNCYDGGINYVWAINAAPSPFVTTWQTTAPNETITIPTIGAGYNYTVSWGDGNTDTGITGNASHVYSVPGVYSVSITGNFPRIFFNNSGHRLKIKSIEQWGSISWTSMNGAFAGCENLVSNATDMPDLSSVTDMLGMFAYARKFNGDANFGNWDVSNVTNMYGMFGGASEFNYPIGNWNVSNVTNMSKMFNGATKFNQDLNSWNVGNVTNMKEMFLTAMNFNGAIGSWDVSNVTDMNAMFGHATNFNQNIGNWDVSNVTDMYGMFGYARAFNQNIGNWNVSNVTDMFGMFGGASVFNQNIGNWNVANVTNMARMFEGATDFNQDLNSWNVGNVTTMNRMFATAMNFNGAVGNWNVANVTDMYGMFGYARKFNQYIGDWNVANVTTMYGMFGAASVFNQDIGNWNVGRVTDMAEMFNGATQFNQDIGGWNVSKVVNMKNMFRTAMNFNMDISTWNVGKVTNMNSTFAFARKFDQNLGNWNVRKVNDMTNFLKGVTLSTANYDALLNGWSSLPLKNNLKFNGGNSKYCAGEAARQYIMTTFNWTIQDGGKECSNPFSGRLAIEENDSASGVSLYPNPMTDTINISLTNGQQLNSISIYDLSGRLIKVIKVTDVSSKVTLDVSDLSNATYMLVIDGQNGRVSKLVVKK